MKKLISTILALTLALALFAFAGNGALADAALKPGETVVFGSYEQDNDLTNGKEPIEWIILEVNQSDNSCVMISKYALDAQPYNTKASNDGKFWETCSLRKWLNEDFYNDAFSAKEQAQIITTRVVNSDYQYTDRNGGTQTGGKDTDDKVWLLSLSEASAVFTLASSRKCCATAYAQAQGADVTSGGYCHWWLRSPGTAGIGFLCSAAYVMTNGGTDTSGSYVDDTGIAVRPVIVYNPLETEETTEAPTADAKTEIALDYATDAELEAALNNGADATGKIVRFEVRNVVPDSYFGYNLWSGEHLNFVTKEPVDAQVGDFVTAKIIKAESFVRSWIISYEIIDIEQASGDMNSEIALDYATDAELEGALNNGADATGKIVCFEVRNVVPDSYFGYNLWSGEHLNFVTKEPVDAQVGDFVTARITKVESFIGSWIISYEVIGIEPAAR